MPAVTPLNTTISWLVQMAELRPTNPTALIGEIGRHTSIDGWYFAPSLMKAVELEPLHTIISVPVQTAAGAYLGEGAPRVEVWLHGTCQRLRDTCTHELQSHLLS
jgi:hypothetical protein